MAIEEQDPSVSHASDCAQRFHNMAECTCFKSSQSMTFRTLTENEEEVADPANPVRAIHDNEDDWWEGD